MEKIAADHIARRMQSAAIGDLNRRRIRICMRVRRTWISRSNSNVMTRNPLNQFALRCDCPIFDARCQPVSTRESKLRSIRQTEFSGPLRGTGQGGNHRSERGRRVASVFFPAILTRDRPL